MCDKHKWVNHGRQNSNIAPKRFQPWYMQRVAQFNREIIQVKVIESHEALEVTDVRQVGHGKD